VDRQPFTQGRRPGRFHRIPRQVTLQSASRRSAALAHLRSATHAYVIFHVPDETAESVQQTIEEARRVSRAHASA
jgi:hypothetical protein